MIPWQASLQLFLPQFCLTGAAEKLGGLEGRNLDWLRFFDDELDDHGSELWRGIRETGSGPVRLRTEDVLIEGGIGHRSRL